MAMMMSTKRLLLLVAVAAAVSCAQGAGTACDLRCWLSQFDITIPDQQFNTSIVGWFNMSNIWCHGIDFGGMSGSAPYHLHVWNENGTDTSPNSVDLAVWGIGTHCYAHWQYLSKVHRLKEGHLNATVSNSTLNLTLTLTKDADGLASMANVSYCNASIRISQLHFTGGVISDELDALENITTALLSEIISNFACIELEELVYTNVTKALQSINTVIRPYLKPQPPPALPLVNPKTEVLTTNAFVNALDFILDDLLGAKGINSIVNRTTNSTGTLRIKLNATADIPVEGLALLKVGVTQVTVSGLNSWEIIDLLEPVSSFSLFSQTLLNSLSINLTFFIDVTVNSTYLQDPQTLHEEADVALSLSGNELQTLMQVAFEAYRAENFTNAMCRDLHCFLSLFYGNGTALTRLLLNISTASLGILAKGGDLEQDVDATLDAVLALLTGSFESCIPAFLNGFVSGPLLLAANDIIAHGLSNNTCEHIPDSKPEGSTVNWIATPASFGAAIIVFIIITVVGLAVTCVMRQRSSSGYSVYSDSVSDSPYAKTPLLDKPSADEDLEGSSTAPCLLLHPRINIFIRFIMPLLILFNIAIFISSNTSGGAAVHLMVETANDKTVSFEPLFTFNLATSVHDMWIAGIWPLSLLIAGFSGAWPYLKLLLMLFAWIVPRRILPIKYREYSLMLLDALGKWSLLDSYVMVLMLVAFHLVIVFPQHDPDHTTLDGQFSFNILVDPLIGFLTFLLATIMSLVLSHFIVALHRYAEMPSEKEADERGSRIESLCTHAFRFKTAVGKWITTVLITVVLLVSLTLMIMGLTATSFSFEFRGLVGWLLAVIGQDTHSDYSVWGVSLQVPDSSNDPNSFTVRTVQVVFILTAMVMPVCHIVMLLFLWLVPMSRRIQRYSFSLCEVLNAWAALEVFVVSIVAALLEIQQFAQFMVEGKCDGVNAIVEKYFDDIVDGDDTCFDVIATLRRGCWLMFAASVMYIATAVVVMRTCHKALRERGRGKDLIN
eukprot:TRINITY_DN161_c0_g1_i1.p1 TRINITY_DN161_c0_g1~~TRINITY_DN161_c0_g1_i1.p1  ORF type:complete len:1006 (-),score=278.27 TRINITY_DN161_c0_g1_i1:44-3061(-)